MKSSKACGPLEIDDLILQRQFVSAPPRRLISAIRHEVFVDHVRNALASELRR